MEQAVVNAVTHDTSEAKVTVSGVSDQPGVAAQMFTSLADAGVNVDMIVQNVSEHGRTDISFTVPHHDAERATELISSLSGNVGNAGCGYDHDIGRVSVIGGIGRAKDCTPVTKALIVCRCLLDKKKQPK